MKIVRYGFLYLPAKINLKSKKQTDYCSERSKNGNKNPIADDICNEPLDWSSGIIVKEIDPELVGGIRREN